SRVHGAGPVPDRRRLRGGREDRGCRAAHGRGDRGDQRGSRRPGLGGTHRGGARAGCRRGRDPRPHGAAAVALTPVHRAVRPRRRGGDGPGKARGRAPSGRQGRGEGSVMTAIAVPLGEPDLLTRSGWAVSDTLTITGRNLLVWMRTPAYIAFTIVQPVIF